MFFPLYMLALAAFAMGTSEFMLAGLVPDIAAGLDVSVGAAGLLTSAFAVGMVVGAPLMAALARHWPPRQTLLLFVSVFAVAHVTGALTTSFAGLVVGRVVAALANAGFLAVALTTAATIAATDQKGRALAILLSGTTLATVAGAPGGAVLGELLGYRATFWAIALLCVPAAIGVAKGVPVRVGRTTGCARQSPVLRTEIAQLAKPTLILVIVLGALINAATFATFTFLAPIVTATAGLDAIWIPAVLALFGLGSFVGITIAGRVSDRRPATLIAVGGPLLSLGWIAMAVLAAIPELLVCLVFVQGALSFALGSTLIARVLYEAEGAPTMGGSYATAALNIGAAGGPALAVVLLGAGTGELGPVWVSSALVALALVVALPLLRVVAPRSGGIPIRE